MKNTFGETTSKIRYFLGNYHVKHIPQMYILNLNHKYLTTPHSYVAAAMLLRCSCRAAATLLPLPPLLCRHCHCCAASAATVLPRCYRCAAAAAALLLPLYCRQAAATATATTLLPLPLPLPSCCHYHYLHCEIG
jgi:hypothetical protein